MFKYVHHIEYIVNNCDAMVEYLEKNFGMKPDHVETNPRGREAHFNVGPTQIQLFEPGDPASAKGKRLAKQGPCVGHVAWGVDDIQKVSLDLQAKGVKLREEKTGSTDKDKVHKPSTVSHAYRTLNTDPGHSLGLVFQMVGRK